SRRRHTRSTRDWSSDVCSSDLASGVKAAHYEIRQKEAFDWPLAVAAVTLKMSGSTGQSARVVMGYVAPVPWPSPEAEQALTGQRSEERRVGEGERTRG